MLTVGLVIPTRAPTVVMYIPDATLILQIDSTVQWPFSLALLLTKMMPFAMPIIDKATVHFDVKMKLL